MSTYRQTRTESTYVPTRIMLCYAAFMGQKGTLVPHKRGKYMLYRQCHYTQFNGGINKPVSSPSFVILSV